LEIASPANPRIKQLVALRRRRIREQAGVTLVEGYEELRLALSAGVRPQALYYCQDLAAPGTLRLAKQVADLGSEVIQVTRQVFSKIAYRETPDGWLAVVPAVPTSLADLPTSLADLPTSLADLPASQPVPPASVSGLAASLAGSAAAGRPLILICEGVEKPGNLGAILRTADAAGVTAVIAADPVTDWGNPNVVRASKGTLFCVPVAAASSADVLAWLSDRALPLVATSPDARTAVTEVDLTGPVALAVGSEKAGLPRQWLARADHQVRIPMFGKADSLNVATSAALVTYEAVRQRMAAGLMTPRR
jgi:TrmH family RNA methyltransferase